MTDHALVARRLATSPYAMTREEAQAHITERRRKLLEAPAPQSVPEPIEPMHAAGDIVKTPELFAENFWKHHPKPPVPSSTKPKKAKPKAPGARPQLRVVDGDKMR